MTTEMALKAKWIRYYQRVMDTFWLRVDKSNGPDACWPWMGTKKPNGYGFKMHKGRAVLSHRIALYGSIENLPTKMACHHCDNPICCNPKHLFWGSAADNHLDMRTKCRNKGAPVKIPENILRELVSNGASTREIAIHLTVHPSSVCRALNKFAILRAHGGSE